MNSKRLSAGLMMLAGLTFACALAGKLSAPTSGAAVEAATMTTSPSNSAPETPTPQPAAQTATLPVTASPAVPANAVLVTTFDQEVYPFKQDGNCALGEAIWSVLTQKAQDGCELPAGGNTIYLPKGTYDLTDEDNSPVEMPGVGGKDRLGLDPAGFPVIAGKLVILGNGSAIQRTGPHKFAIFQVFVRGDLTLDHLTISGGDASTRQYSGADGGALQVLGGQVNLDHVTLSGNHGGNGGAIELTTGSVSLQDSAIQGNVADQNGGGIDSSGTLSLKDSVISGNIARNSVFGGGGIYNTGGTLTIDHSRIEGNTALEGGGIYNDGGTLNIIAGSMIDANQASESQSSIPHGGGGINNIAASGDTAQVTISDSFILGNQAANTTGGGIYNQGSLTVTHSVIAGNVGGAGGALYNDSEGSGSISGSCILQNQAVAVKPAGLGSGIDSGSDTPFAAAHDWWGAAAGPAAGQSVTRNVSASDYLQKAPDICATELPTPAITPPAP